MSMMAGEKLLLCPHCGSVAEYVSEHAKGKRWAVACTMTSKVAADEGKLMCRCRTPFFRDKGQARDIWNRRVAVTDHDFAMAVHDGELWRRVKNHVRCPECGLNIESLIPLELACNRHAVKYCPKCGAMVKAVNQ